MDFLAFANHVATESAALLDVPLRLELLDGLGTERQGDARSPGVHAEQVDSKHEHDSDQCGDRNLERLGCVEHTHVVRGEGHGSALTSQKLQRCKMERVESTQLAREGFQGAGQCGTRQLEECQAPDDCRTERRGLPTRTAWAARSCRAILARSTQPDVVRHHNHLEAPTKLANELTPGIHDRTRRRRGSGVPPPSPTAPPLPVPAPRTSAPW